MCFSMCNLLNPCESRGSPRCKNWATPRNHYLPAMKNAFTVLTAVLCSTAMALLAGCYISNREIKYSIKGAVPVGTAISVTTPEDGIYMEDVYPNSGKVVARKLVAALTPYYPGSTVSSTDNRGVYLIEPKILHWEDRERNGQGKQIASKSRCRFIARGVWWARHWSRQIAVGGPSVEIIRKTCSTFRLKPTPQRWPAKQIQIAWFSSDRQTLCLLLGRALQL